MKEHKVPDGRKKLKRGENGLRVLGIHYVPTIDADVRLSRAISILLRSAAIRSPQSKKDADMDSDEPHNAAGKGGVNDAD